MMQTEWRVESLDIAQEIKQHAEARNTKAQYLALAWVLNNKFITSVIGGPRTEEQWADATPPASTEYKPGDKDMKAAKMLKEEEMRLRRRLQAVMERRLALKRRIMESL
jgi:aryl-alcohol dehydrogenase-like predicted oxidoreductase